MEKLAIDGGQPVRTKPFPSGKKIGKEELEQLEEVIASGNMFHGAKVEEFRKGFANMFGSLTDAKGLRYFSRFCALCSSMLLLIDALVSPTHKHSASASASASWLVNTKININCKSPRVIDFASTYIFSQ